MNRSLLIGGDNHSDSSLVQFAIAVWVLACSIASAQSSGSFVWTDQSGASSPLPMTVHFRVPSALRPDTPVWFALHGEDRNAADYRDYLAASPAASDALILAPQFSESQWPGTRSYNLGNVSASETNLSPRPVADWSFSKIEPLFDYVRQSLAPELLATSYSMYGHSAGAQFLHRFLLWRPSARVNVAVAANAGWYTIPTDLTSPPPGAYPYAWPYSLATAPDYAPSTPLVDRVPASNVAAAFDRRLVVLLGEDDTQITSSLRTTTEANAQGPHRLARGHFFFEASADEAADRNLPFAWGLDVVPDVGHSGQLMAPRAAEWLRAGNAILGDLNADGRVDAADYGAWRAAYGTSQPRGLMADANADGRVDAADYTVWRDLSSTGVTGSSGSHTTAVPEPVAIALVPMAVVASLFASRTRVGALCFVLASAASVAHAAPATGADLIVGRGAHPLQAVERIGRSWVFHSLGNFAVQTAGRFRDYGAPPFSSVPRVTLPGSVVRAELGFRTHEIYCDDLHDDDRARSVDADELEIVRQMLIARSDEEFAAEAVGGRNDLGYCSAVGCRCDERIDSIAATNPVRQMGPSAGATPE